MRNFLHKTLENVNKDAIEGSKKPERLTNEHEHTEERRKVVEYVRSYLHDRRWHRFHLPMKAKKLICLFGPI